jgi:phosphatidylinositol alpha-1,6-mannosyltransferase
MTGRPRVLVLQQGAPGGIGRIELLMWRALQAREVSKVCFVSRRRPAAGLAAVPGGPRTRLLVVASPIGYVLRSLWEAVVARPDVVVYTHVNTARLQPVVRLLRPRARTVLYVHGREIWERLSWLQRFALRSSGRLVLHTRFVGETLDTQGTAHAPMTVVHPSLSDDWAADVEPRSAPTGEAVVLTVSRLECDERQKGVDRVIEAFPTVLERVPGATLRVVGDGTDRERLEGLAASLGLERRVQFLGAVDDATLKRLYASSDVFALPSVQEGFGLVYAEAMAHGLPCVVAAGTAAREVVDVGVTGLAVDPDSVDDLADAVVTLLTDPDRWRRMSRAAADRFQRCFREAVYGQGIRRVLLEAG